MEWMLLPLKRYADFSGRSRRKEYWMFILLQVIVILPVIVILGTAGYLDEGGQTPVIASILLGLLGLFFLAVFIPSLAVQVRRLHDIDRSGWWILLGLIPIVNYIGGIVLFVFYCLDGTKGPNRFGPDPKMDDKIGDVFD